MTTDPGSNSAPTNHTSAHHASVSESPTLTQAESMERDLKEALCGRHVREIGRYQVYSDYRSGETVVFVHDPSGVSDHKYIFAHTSQHTYIVAAPVKWTALHREILARVSAASGERAVCPGGGYVLVKPDGSLLVSEQSTDFGAGDHARAKRAFEDAIRKSADEESHVANPGDPHH